MLGGPAQDAPNTPHHAASRLTRVHQVKMSSSGSVCVIRSSMLICPSIYQSTMRDASVRPRALPRAVPFNTRPGHQLEQSCLDFCPAPATPTITDRFQPRWQSAISIVAATITTASIGLTARCGDRVQRLFWIDAATLRCVARSLRNSVSSGAPMSRGWRF